MLDGGGSNVVAFSSADGIVLVDTGAPNNGDRVMAALKGLGGNAKVHTVFNTHYHLAQTGNNEAFAAAGAKIVAHDRTRQWMSVDHWLPDQDRYEKARPKAAWPTDVFFNTGSQKIGGEQIDYGYLLVAHTAGDIYVYFKRLERACRRRRGVAGQRPRTGLDHRRVDRRARQCDGRAAEDRQRPDAGRSGYRPGDDMGRVQGGT